MRVSGRSAMAAAAVVLMVSFGIGTPSNPRTPASKSLFSQVAMPAPVAHSLKSACANCHSNDTVWPWYVHVPVASLLLVHDVNHARQNLNFSDWQKLQDKGPEELAAGFSGICENLLSGAMPKRGYRWMHPDARLSKSQIAEVCSWTEKKQMESLRQLSSTAP